MKEVTWMTDYLPVHMLAMAQRAERRFADCLMSCPKTEDGVIDIDDPEIFTRLIEERITSTFLTLAALESYLGYYAAQTAKTIEDQDPGVALEEHLEKHGLLEIIKYMPSRDKRRHEFIMEENGKKPVTRFLTAARLTLEDKLNYWPLLRTGSMIDFRDGYIKKMKRVINLRDELLQQDFNIAPSVKRISTAAEMKHVTLHHDAPEGLTPGRSFSDEYVEESYQEGHFFWELLHVYPARAVQEFIMYLHGLDGSDNHFIAALCAAELVDSDGNPITEPAKRFAVEFNLGD
jgi:hypothetical protein